MALITENNRQYYAGAQGFMSVNSTASGQAFTCTFDTDLVFGNHNPLEIHPPSTT